MPSHNILYLVEHDKTRTKNTDNLLIILYDESVEKYYCYGTRRRLNSTEINNELFDDYQLAFSVDKMDLLLKWISLLNNEFRDVYTVEMHQISLDEDDYETLDFTSLKNRITKFTELYAYDKVIETEGSILEKLDVLQCLVNF